MKIRLKNNTHNKSKIKQPNLESCTSCANLTFHFFRLFNSFMGNVRGTLMKNLIFIFNLNWNAIYLPLLAS